MFKSNVQLELLLCTINIFVYMILTNFESDDNTFPHHLICLTFTSILYSHTYILWIYDIGIYLPGYGQSGTTRPMGQSGARVAFYSVLCSP